jgi:F-type H+-transporting ATPase subunit c
MRMPTEKPLPLDETESRRGLEEISMMFTPNRLSGWIRVLPVVLVSLLVASTAFAQEGNAMDYKGFVGLGAGIGIGLAVVGGGLGQGIAARAALEGIARNPNASGRILVPMILGLALIESLVIIAFIITYSLRGFVA